MQELESCPICKGNVELEWDCEKGDMVSVTVISKVNKETEKVVFYPKPL